VVQRKFGERIFWIFLYQLLKNHKRIYLNPRKKALNSVNSIVSIRECHFECGGCRAETIYFVDPFGCNHLFVHDVGLFEVQAQRLYGSARRAGKSGGISHCVARFARPRCLRTASVVYLLQKGLPILPEGRATIRAAIRASQPLNSR